MKKLIKFTITIICILLVFTGCSSNSVSNPKLSLNKLTQSIEKKPNRQYTAKNILQKEIPSDTRQFYNYANTNGNEYLSNVYYTNTNPDEAESYKNNYSRKYTYYYLNGDPINSTFKIQRYIRNEKEDEPNYYDYEFYYVRGYLCKDKLEQYYSYEYSENGTQYEDENICYSYSDDGKLNEYIEDLKSSYYFYYDENGMLSARTYDPINAFEYASFDYEQDDNGNISSVTKTYDNGGYDSLIHTYKYKYEYDDKNRIICEAEYSVNNNAEELLQNEITYSYDENGNISTVNFKSYNSETEECNYSTSTYVYTSQNNISRIINQNGNQASYIVFDYSNSPNSYSESQDEN